MRKEKGYTMYKVVIVMIILIILERIIIACITFEGFFWSRLIFLLLIFFILISQKVLRVFVHCFHYDEVQIIWKLSWEWNICFFVDFKPRMSLHNIFISETFNVWFKTTTKCGENLQRQREIHYWNYFISNLDYLRSCNWKHVCLFPQETKLYQDNF